MRRGLSVLALALGLAGVACAHQAIPSDQLTAAQANVARAEQMGANANPDAAYHLRLARQQLDQGKKLMDKEENLEASYVLKRAAADGELAIAITDYGTASSEAEQARARVQNLRERSNTVGSPSTVTPGTDANGNISNSANTNNQTR